MVISCTVKLKKDSFQLLLHEGKNVSIVDSGMHMTQLPRVQEYQTLARFWVHPLFEVSTSSWRAERERERERANKSHMIQLHVLLHTSSMALPFTLKSILR